MQGIWALVGTASAFVLSLGAASANAQLSTADRQALLDRLNQVRAETAAGLTPGLFGNHPQATNMTSLLWDPGLESVATGWASQCQWGANPNRSAEVNASSTRFPLPVTAAGENSFASTESQTLALLLSGIDNWANESLSFDYASNTCDTGQTCGHYTQVVWANTRYVGCGWAQCPSIPPLPFGGTLFVCDFAPAGNFIAQSPYEAGPACSSCPGDWNTCNAEGLCAGCSTTLLPPNASCSEVPVACSEGCEQLTQCLASGELEEWACDVPSDFCEPSAAACAAEHTCASGACVLAVPALQPTHPWHLLLGLATLVWGARRLQRVRAVRSRR